MPVQLFGIGKAAFNGFLARRVEAFAQIGQPVGVDLLLEGLPDVAGEELLGVLALGAAGALGSVRNFVFETVLILPAPPRRSRKNRLIVPSPG